MDFLQPLARWPALRSAFLGLVFLAATGCQQQTDYFGTVEPPPGNVFRFNNGAEPEFLDPGLITGQPDGRIARLLFEGLTDIDQETLQARPGVAERWDLSPDQRTYTFYLRKDAVWSDGRPITAHDFVYSWRRVLDPATASRYASHLYHIVNGQEFNEGKITDPSQVAVRALDDFTLEVRLSQPVPFFLYLTSFYTYFPVPRHVVERHGGRWTNIENIVGNGPFLIAEHRTRDRFVLTPNPQYWNASRVRLDRIIAYAVEDTQTSANMYKAGMIDWVPSTQMHGDYVPYLQGRFRDLRTLPFLAIYYYLINVTKPPFDNPQVRRALSMAIDRRAITDDLLRGGQMPGAHFVPLGFPNYQSPPGPDYNPQEAARLLAQAGFPGGAGFPEISILFNTLEMHRKIAEAIQQMWGKTLHIRVTLRNEEWASYLKSTNDLNYDVARRGWVADYPDPSTFTDLMESTNGNNNTGWKNAAYDRFISLARQERDPLERMKLLQRSETILLEDVPVIPIFTSASNNLIKPYVRGFRPSPTEEFPLDEFWIDYEWNARSDGAVSSAQLTNDAR